MADHKRIYDEFVDANYNSMRRYCVSRGINSYDADEIVNAAFYRLSRKWALRWNLGDVKNKKWVMNAIEYIIKEHRRSANKIFTENIDDYDNVLESDDPVTQCVENDQYEIYKNEIISRLNKNDAELFTLRYIEQLDYAEIEQRLSISNGALRVRMTRLKSKLIEIINDLIQN